MINELPGLGSLPDVGEQPALLGVEPSAREVVGEVADPVAHVHVILPQPHLNRVFDYLIPQKFDAVARVGARVQVDVAGIRTQGFIVARDSVVTGAANLRELRKVFSGVPVLSPAIYRLARAVARRWAGSVADVLSLAVPQRHARAEKDYEDHGGGSGGAEAAGASVASTVSAVCRASLPEETGTRGLWSSYDGGPAFFHHLAQGDGPQAVCMALNGKTRESVAEAVAEARAVGKGVLVVLPSSREAEDYAAFIEQSAGEKVTVFRGDEPHEERYGKFLSILSGSARVVVGTRGAIWAPVRNLGLVVLVDDAAPSLREQRAPYAPCLDVLSMRASMESAAFLCLADYVSLEAQNLLATDRAQLMRPLMNELPRVSTSDQWQRDGGEWSRLPESAFALVRDAIKRGPVLVVVPRAGYIPLVACSHCREIAACTRCGGNLSIGTVAQAPTCSRCGATHARWQCPNCGSGALRAVRLGSHRTAEEIGKAFAGIGIRISGAQTSEGIISRVSAKPRIVVATPGAEPYAEGGFSAALVLDSRFLMGDGPGAEIEFLRRASRVVSRVRPAKQDGHVLFVGGADPEIVSLLGAGATATYTRDLFQERAELRLPPAVRWLGVTGAARDVRAFVAVMRVNLAGTAGASPAAVPTDALLAGGIMRLTDSCEVLGPVEAHRAQEVTVYLRMLADDHEELARAGAASCREYSAKKLGAPLRIEMDPSV